MKDQKIPEIDGIAYTAESLLGEGGAARVFRVRSSADGKEYALKRIAKTGSSSKRVQRFRNEIKFGMSAKNKHVVKVHAWLEDDDFFYYTMDLYPKSLRDVIKNESDFEVLLEYISQLCDGLAYIHANGVTHRDIKPENILVDDVRRRLVLADFGIAHFKNSTLTAHGEILANRNYQAPEQMAKKRADQVAEPADIFSLGLIITELFTKQNSRGARHLRVGDIHPFLSELDLLTELMQLQDETERIGIEAVRDSLGRIRAEVGAEVDDIVESLQDFDSTRTSQSQESKTILERAGRAVLSAKNIFERTTDDALSRYNRNYLCEISFNVSEELFSACVQLKIYSLCKAKFEYESNGSWEPADLDAVVSPAKTGLLDEFQSIQRDHRLSPNSIWEAVPRRALNYFRFCKDYHCEELLEAIREVVSNSGAGSLQDNLRGAPILWIVGYLRDCLATDIFPTDPSNLQRVALEHQLRVDWATTSPQDTDRLAIGADLLDKRGVAESVRHILEVFEKGRNVSLVGRNDGTYWVHFRVRDEYEQFRAAAIALATPDSLFEADVSELLRPHAVYGDLVVLVWEPIFGIPVTLAKVLGLKQI